MLHLAFSPGSSWRNCRVDFAGGCHFVSCSEVQRPLYCDCCFSRMVLHWCSWLKLNNGAGAQSANYRLHQNTISISIMSMLYDDYIIMIICYVYKCVLLSDFMPLCFLVCVVDFCCQYSEITEARSGDGWTWTRSEWMYFLQPLQFRISQDALDLLLQAKHLRVPVASRDESATLKVV